jgi:agmatine deiminase
MPVEAVRHAATWSVWPVGEELWAGRLDAVRDDMAGLVAALARFEAVVLLVADDEARRDAEARLGRAGVASGAVRFVAAPSNDVWLRDAGPLFLRGADGRLAATDWRFDGWGGKYASELDDRLPERIASILGVRRFAFDVVLEGGAIEMGADGTLLTTRSCLLDGVRNPGWDEAAYQRALRDALGATRLAWLEGGLVDDHTDGHVDTVARFAAEDAIVCVVADDDDGANRATLDANRERLASLRRADGSAYRLFELPLPEDRSTVDGVRPPRSYANFCLVNGGVVVPIWNDPRDGEALAVLQAAFPGREVVGVPATALVTGGGAFHCVTQHQPEGGTPS